MRLIYPDERSVVSDLKSNAKIQSWSVRPFQVVLILYECLEPLHNLGGAGKNHGVIHMQVKNQDS